MCILQISKNTIYDWVDFFLIFDFCAAYFTHYVLYHCVFKAVVMVLESKGDTASHMMIKLLQAFWKMGLITVDQMNRVSPFLYESI